MDEKDQANWMPARNTALLAASTLGYVPWRRQKSDLDIAGIRISLGYGAGMEAACCSKITLQHKIESAP
jgi:hypothetical protein